VPGQWRAAERGRRCDAVFDPEHLKGLLTGDRIGPSRRPALEAGGQEPSNYTFNSIIELEQEGGKPRNPFVNAGALVTTDAMLDAPDAGGGLDELMDFVRTAAGDDRISIDEQVAA
jgi:glutaminase